MIAGKYVCELDWHGNREYDIEVEAKETEKSFILKLIRDDSRYKDGHMEVLFGDSGRVVINKDGSPHAIVNNDDWFVVYPNRNGVPFLFELKNEGELK